MTEIIHQDYMDGYTDGRNPDTPEPSGNRSERYKHSFAVGRAELANKPIAAWISRKRADFIEIQEALNK